MKRTLSVIVSLCSVVGSVGFAQTPSIADLAKAKIYYTITVPAHLETYKGGIVKNISEKKIYSTEWSVRNSPLPAGSSKVTASGSLMELPQFQWIKSVKIADQITSGRKTGGARVKINSNMLIRDSNFNASAGTTSGAFHEAWRTVVVPQKDSSGSFQIPSNQTDVIAQALETDVQNASTAALKPMVEQSCEGMCLLNFEGTTITGLDQKNISVDVYAGDVKPGRVITIDWPAYTITSTFSLAAKTAKDLATESTGN